MVFPLEHDAYGNVSTYRMHNIKLYAVPYTCFMRRVEIGHFFFKLLELAPGEPMDIDVTLISIITYFFLQRTLV